ncbi:MAG: class I SAM-dependent methyltransferase [Pirellulales bacterium]|nr:class I SAM-dependent methyltransferase [Pirellulales bacterium]
MHSNSQACPVGASDIADYYDVFCQRQINDFVHGNRRVAAAIELALREIPINAGSLLDIGCGIGISSHAFAEAKPQLQVVAVDISPRSIDIAKRLFDRPNLKFEASDLSNVPTDRSFDVICLLDVYEHIPPQRVTEFHQFISRALTDRGKVIVTCPSPLHQRYLLEFNPDGLQIVDETRELSDFVTFACDIGATIVHFEWVDVWRSNQYVHVVMERSPELVPVRKSRPRTRASRFNLSKRAANFLAKRQRHRGENERRERVMSRLGIDVA